MAVAPEDFLRLAQDLLNKNPGSEIDHRTAAARAYYAVMHLVRSELRLDPTASTHSSIRDEMYRVLPAHTPAWLQAAKAAWRRLHDTRRRADYLVDELFDLGAAQASVKTARHILQLRAGGSRP